MSTSQEVISYNGGGRMYAGMTLEEALRWQDVCWHNSGGGQRQGVETLGEARYTEDEDSECDDSEEETSDDMEEAPKLSWINAPKPSWIRHRAIRAGIPCKLWRCRFKCLCSVPRKGRTGPHKWNAEARIWVQ